MNSRDLKRAAVGTVFLRPRAGLRNGPRRIFLHTRRKTPHLRCVEYALSKARLLQSQPETVRASFTI